MYFAFASLIATIPVPVVALVAIAAAAAGVPAEPISFIAFCLAASIAANSDASCAAALLVASKVRPLTNPSAVVLASARAFVAPALALVSVPALAPVPVVVCPVPVVAAPVPVVVGPVPV